MIMTMDEKYGEKCKYEIEEKLLFFFAETRF